MIDLHIMIQTMLELFLLIVIGFAAGKLQIMDHDMNSKLSRLLLTVSLPAFVVSAVLQADRAVSTSQVFTVFGFCLLFYFFNLLLAWPIPWLLRASPNQWGMYRFMALFSNSAFMGYPVILAVLGNTALLYASILNVPNALLVFSLGLFLAVGKNGEVKMSWRLLLNPGIVAAVLSLVIYLTGLRFPVVIEKTLSMTGQMMTPGAMLVLGASLAELPLRGIFNDWKIYIFSAIRLLLIPFLTWLVFSRLISDSLVLGVIVLTAAMPVANNATLFSARYHSDLALAAKGVFVSTLLSVITIPLIVYVLPL